MSRPKVVAFGGGHGLSASLQALRQFDCDITAIVTVADDGGSSGRLRREFGLLPPGDLRQALVALAADSETAALWQHRLPGSGPLAGHAVGNIALAGLFQQHADPAAALAAAGRQLAAQGRVLPMAAEPLEIRAEVAIDDVGTTVVGQANVAATRGRVRRVWVVPAAPAVCPPAIAAIREADWLIFGPGSWFTSVLPHLVVPALRDAIAVSSARRIVVLNIPPDRETAGLAPADHIRALVQHDEKFRADIVLGDKSVMGGDDRLAGAAESVGGRLLIEPVAAADDGPRHDATLLAAALTKCITVKHQWGW